MENIYFDCVLMLRVGSMQNSKKVVEWLIFNLRLLLQLYYYSNIAL